MATDRITWLRQKIAFYLEDIKTPIGQAFNLIITGLVLLSSAIFVIETYPIPDYVRIYLDLINFSIVVLFAWEYLLRLWCADNKLNYLFSIYSIIDLIAILPFLLGLKNLSFFLILRLFMIFKMIYYLEHVELFGSVYKNNYIIFSRILFTLFAILFIYSGLIYQVEHPLNFQVFKTFLDAFYFSVVTMTTVGFGDVTPRSEIGRLLTVLMIFTGIALIPLQVGDLVKHLVKSSDRIEKNCPECSLSSHDTDAQFCKICGTKLNEQV